MGMIKAICISEKKGTQKYNVQTGNVIKDWGIEQDAHAGKWNRQISLLSYEKIEQFQEKGVKVEFGAFGENLVVEGIDFEALPIGTRLQCGEVILEITQIGKECNSHCSIYKIIGDCIMPREGIFTRVIQGGTLTVGDTIMKIEQNKRNCFRTAIITLSDSAFEGKRNDESGSFLTLWFQEHSYEIIEQIILPDEQVELEKELIYFSDNRQIDLIITTGGTGLSARDITPEATKAVATKEVPGIAEAIRAYSMKFTKRAMLSRGLSVIRNNTLIINLPGSPKAVCECMEFLQSELQHALQILTGKITDCGRK